MAEADLSEAPLALTDRLQTIESLLDSLSDARFALDPLFAAFAAGADPSTAASGPPALLPVSVNAAFGNGVNGAGQAKQKRWKEASDGAREAIKKLRTTVEGSQSPSSSRVAVAAIADGVFMRCSGASSSSGIGERRPLPYRGSSFTVRTATTSLEGDHHLFTISHTSSPAIGRAVTADG